MPLQLPTTAPKNRICGSVVVEEKNKTPKQNKEKHIITSSICVTFRSQGSKALRAYNQYYIFHCHLHSYCKWLVSKIITGCIRNLGFAISPLVLEGPQHPPAPTLVSLAASLQRHWVLMTRQRTLLATPLTPPLPPIGSLGRLLCTFFISLLLTHAAENLTH